MSEIQSVIVIGAFTLVLLVLESLAPGRPLPRVRFWWARVACLQAGVILTITFGVGLWQETLMSSRLIDGAAMFSPFWGGVVSYFSGTFVFYWWHRWRHDVPFLWSVFHQIHHSPARVQTVTAFYVHPIEAVASSLLNALLVFVAFGLSKEALTTNATLMGMAGVFYHSNIRTPRWLGYLIQRPEMHVRHHELGAHWGNYSDIPIWDICFGTFINPLSVENECGFGEAKELRFMELMAYRDVNH